MYGTTALLLKTFKTSPLEFTPLPLLMPMGVRLISLLRLRNPMPLLALLLPLQTSFVFGQSTGAIDLSVNGGTAPYTYLWSNNATSQDINALPIGFYSVVVNDANGCIHNASANIYQPASPVNVSAIHKSRFLL